MIILNIRTVFLDLPIQKGRKNRKQRRKKNEKNTNHVALNDSNCKCKFKFGVSEHFSSAIDSHRSDIQMNQSSAKVNQTLFQDLLSEFPDTDTNDFQVENSIIHQLQNGFESNYNDVLKYENKKLVAIPETFRLTSKAISLSINGLESRIKAERAKQGQPQYVTKQIEKMENVLKNMKGDVAENKVYSALRKLWNGKRGILIHSFKPENVLAPLTKRAKAQRDSAKQLECTALEEILARQLNIDIDDEANEIEKSIRQEYHGKKKITSKQLLDFLEKEIRDKKKCNTLTSIVEKMSKNMNQKNYDFDEVRQLISVALTHHFFRPDGELDYLAALPDNKLILNIEVKYQISKRCGQARKLLSNAASQTSRNEKYLARILAPMLSQGWRLVKVAAILPGTLERHDLCDYCKKFVITSKSLETIENWWEQTMLDNNYGSPSSYKEFLNFVELAAPAVMTSQSSVWTRITGSKNKLPISAGHTINEPPVLKRGKFGKKARQNLQINKKFDEALERVHDAEKILFFSSSQLDILTSSHFLCVVLWGDYGTGKL